MPKIATPPSEILALTLVLCGEVVIGMALGFVGRLVFAALEIAAHFVGAQMGFSLAGTIDPSTQAQTAAFGIVAQMLGLMVLVGANAHHWFLAATIKSFDTTAPGSFVVTPQLAEVFIRLSANALAVGVSLAAPAIIVLLVVEFGLEFFGRTAPSFQVFILGFPVKIAVGLWLIGASIYLLPNATRDVLSGIYLGLLKVLEAM
jgi:flagellar biosynthetic protein FliR